MDKSTLNMQVAIAAGYTFAPVPDSDKPLFRVFRPNGTAMTYIENGQRKTKMTEDSIPKNIPRFDSDVDAIFEGYSD